MRRDKILKKMILSAGMVFGGGTVLAGGCINTLASINLCGTVLTFCTPVDQINALFPLLEVPDFNADPSCTIPLGCGDGGILPPLEGGPGGDPPEEPQEAGAGLNNTFTQTGGGGV